jgi:hypothetical protein
MKILQKYITYNKHKEKLDSEKELLVDIINIYLKILFKNTINSDYDLHIEKKFLTKDYCSTFVNMDVLIITESDDKEYTAQYTIPICLFKVQISDLKKEYDKLIQLYYDKVDERRREELEFSKQSREILELKEYKRLKRKYGNK